MFAAAINDLIAGECPSTNRQSEVNEFQSVSLTLGSTVPTKIKSKIWADEFVELRSLTKETEEDEFTFTVWKNRSGSSIATIPTGHKATIIDNIEEWTNAMMTLGAIYTGRHPRSSPALFKYIKTVRDTATGRFTIPSFANRKPSSTGSRTSYIGSCILMQ